MAKLGAHRSGDIDLTAMRERATSLRKSVPSLGKAVPSLGKAIIELPARLRRTNLFKSSVTGFTLLITSLFLLTFFGLLGAKLYSDYNAELSRAENNTNVIAALNAAHIETLFNTAASILALVEEASGSLSSEALQALADKAETASPNIHAVLIVDQFGEVLDKTRLPLSASLARAVSDAATSGWGQNADTTRYALDAQDLNAQDMEPSPVAGIVFPSRGLSSGEGGYFSLSQPLVLRDGRQKIAIAFIAADQIGQFLAASGAAPLLGHGGSASLISDSGQVHAISPQILAPSQGRVLEEAIAELGKAPASTSTRTTTRTTTRTIGYLPLSGGEVLFARQPVGQSAAMIVLLPMADAAPGLRQSGPLLISFSAVAILFALSFASFLIRQTRRVESTDLLLEQSEQLFDLAATSAKCGIWNWNVDGEVMYWSSSVMHLLGFESAGAKLSFNEALNLVHPSDRKYLRRVEKGMRSGQTEFDTKYRLKHADGHFIWVRARGEVKIARSNSTGAKRRTFYGIIIDMTDELLAAAREEQARVTLRNAIENISDGFVLWDRNRQTVLTNSKYDTLQPFDADAAWKAIDEDQEIEQADGRWLQMKSNRIAGGGAVTIARDITDLKLKNAALEESRQALGDTITDLQTSRSHLRVLARNFEEEKRRAEEASRSKTEFLANMSHELRTPLNAIIGFSEIMETGMFGPLGDERYNEYASDIRMSGRSLLELIDDILDMSRIESGKYEVDCQTLETSALLDDCLRLVEARADEKKIEIINKTGLVPEIFADKGATKHVLLNVLSNAVKFSHGPNTVVISAKADLHKVTLTVADNGIGITAEDLAKLGTPFVQLETQNSKKHRGSGLGIAISISLVELMAGTLTIQSELGKGTRVSITLPRRAIAN